MDVAMQNEQCIQHDMTIKVHAEKLEQLEHAMYGNGKIGVKEEVAILRTQMKIIITIGVATLSGVVAVLVKLITM
jgi:hypothetical protein